MIPYLEDALKNRINIQADYQCSLHLKLSCYDFCHHTAYAIVNNQESSVYF